MPHDRLTRRPLPARREGMSYRFWLTMADARTLAQKIWDRHVVRSAPGEPDLLFIDLHLVHEVTSPQAFEALRLAGRRVRRPDLTVATMDHNTPTLGRRDAADEVGTHP